MFEKTRRVKCRDTAAGAASLLGEIIVGEVVSAAAALAAASDLSVTLQLGLRTISKWSYCRMLGYCFILFCAHRVIYLLPSKHEGWELQNCHHLFLLKWAQQEFFLCCAERCSFKMQLDFTSCSVSPKQFPSFLSEPAEGMIYTTNSGFVSQLRFRLFHISYRDLWVASRQ